MLEKIDQAVLDLLDEVRHRTLNRMQASYDIDLKSSYKDLVTTVDKKNDQYISTRLHEIDPGSRVVSEEGFGDEVATLTGHVWIVDPIDGTMNFVMQHANFYIMIALYVDGKPTLGYIMDVIDGTVYHGGKKRGVFENNRRLTSPANNGLKDSLVALNSAMILNNAHNLREVAHQSRGLRMYGAAGMELVYVLTGQLGAYLSYLHPWDLAAGRVLAEAMGLVVKAIDAPSIDVLSSNLVLIATKQAADDVLALVN